MNVLIYFVCLGLMVPLACAVSLELLFRKTFHEILSHVPFADWSLPLVTLAFVIALLAASTRPTTRRAGFLTLAIGGLIGIAILTPGFFQDQDLGIKLGVLVILSPRFAGTVLSAIYAAKNQHPSESPQVL